MRKLLCEQLFCLFVSDTPADPHSGIQIQGQSVRKQQEVLFQASDAQDWLGKFPTADSIKQYIN